MRRFAIVFLVVAAGCSKSGDPAQIDGGTQPDAKHAPDARPDAPLPPQGNACPQTLHEVGRITGANLSIDDRGFYGATYKQGLYTRDADHDGRADIISVEYVSGTVGAYNYQIRIFPQTATAGTFGAPITSAITFPGYGPGFNAIGDINGDHLADIVFEWEDDGDTDRTEYLYVATQDANHKFTLQPRIDVSACKSTSDERLAGFAIADVDKDGKDDVLATVNYDGLGGVPAGLAILKGATTNLAAAHCIASQSVTTTGIPYALSTADALWADDFDGDGTTDLVAAIADQLHYFHATGASAFTELSGTVPEPTWRVTMTDHVGGRTAQDLVNADIHETDTTINRFTVGASGVAAAPPVTLTAGDPQGYGDVGGVVAGDFNGDGLTDTLEVGAAGGTFALACDRATRQDVTVGAVDAGLTAMRTIDLDGDGKSEIAAVVGADVVIYAVQ